MKKIFIRDIFKKIQGYLYKLLTHYLLRPSTYERLYDENKAKFRQIGICPSISKVFCSDSDVVQYENTIS